MYIANIHPGFVILSAKMHLGSKTRQDKTSICRVPQKSETFKPLYINNNDLIVNRKIFAKFYMYNL